MVIWSWDLTLHNVIDTDFENCATPFDCLCYTSFKVSSWLVGASLCYHLMMQCDTDRSSLGRLPVQAAPQQRLNTLRLPLIGGLPVMHHLCRLLFRAPLQPFLRHHRPWISLGLVSWRERMSVLWNHSRQAKRRQSLLHWWRNRDSLRNCSANR